MSSYVASPPRSLVRLFLELDGVVTGVNGVAYIAGATMLDEVLGLSVALQRGVGVFLVAFAAFVAFVATRRVVPRSGVLFVVAANFAWTATSVIVAIAGIGTPTAAGRVWIVLQAVVVAAMAELQLYALKKETR